MESAVSLDNTKPPMNTHQQLVDIVEPTVHDVLCGRGVTTNKWAGNEQFRSLVGLNKELYVTSTKRQKMAISRSIVDAVRSMNPPGRFLEKSVDTGLWNDIGNRKAIEKTSQALRDGAAIFRKQLSADLGDPEFLSAVFDMESSAAAAKAASNSSLPPKEKEKEKISAIKAKSNMKKGLSRSMSNPDVTSSFKEKSIMKRALKRLDTPNSQAEIHDHVRGVCSNPTSPLGYVRGARSNPTSPRDLRMPNGSYRAMYPRSSQYPPLQVEFSGPRGYFEGYAEYPMRGESSRRYDAGYENYEGRLPYSTPVSWFPPASGPMPLSNQPVHPGARHYPPLPHPTLSRKPRSPSSSWNYDSYWRNPYASNAMPSSPAGSVRSGGTVRSSPATMQDFGRRTQHHRQPYPPHFHHSHYYHHRHSQHHDPRYARHPTGHKDSMSPSSNPTSSASPGDFTPPISPNSDRISKREETVLTARNEKAISCPSQSPDVVSSYPDDNDEADESFGFEVVLRERDEATKDTPLRNDYKRGHIYFSYNRDNDDKDDPAQISQEEDPSTSPFHYEHDEDMDGPVCGNFMMDISDDLLLEPIAPVGPMDEAHVFTSSRDHTDFDRASQ